MANEKKTLRAEVTARLRAMSADERQERSARAVARLLASAEFQRAGTVLAYDSAALEVDTSAVFQACCAQRKTLGLPRTCAADRSITIHAVAGPDRDLERSRFGFREPKGGTPVIPVAQIDLAIVPGVAFDPQGNRLGRGAGYYDRFLAQGGLHAALCALAFDCQVVPAVPVLPHDLPLHLVFTETRTIRADRSQNAK
ncbi:MAG: 5-formyltetrahydrofolate cyclo-ligase [Planctomycetota bacterium]|nr:5-formyltetrahydrofolate cyclo-ligase [Planctomycetota bacterium]